MMRDEDYQIIDDDDDKGGDVRVVTQCKIGFGIDKERNKIFAVMRALNMEHVFLLGSDRARELATAIFRASDMTRAEPNIRRDVFSISKVLHNRGEADGNGAFVPAGAGKMPVSCNMQFNLFCFDGLVCGDVSFDTDAVFHLGMPAEQARQIASLLMSLVDEIEGAKP